MCIFFFFSSRRRHTRWPRDWSSDVCSSDLGQAGQPGGNEPTPVGGESPLDDSEVHGAQGTAENAFEEVHPPTEKTPPTQQASAETPVVRSYLIDTDVVVSVQGQLIEIELTRN